MGKVSYKALHGFIWNNKHSYHGKQEQFFLYGIEYYPLRSGGMINDINNTKYRKNSLIGLYAKMSISVEPDGSRMVNNKKNWKI